MTPVPPTLVHATCIAMDGVGVLLRGPPGSGKSDLALRLIDGGAALVADDQVALTPEDGRLIARPPDSLAGRMEVRGVGIETVASVERATVALVIDLVPPAAVDRLPVPACCRLLGVSVAGFSLAPFEASAAAKVRVAVRAVTRDSNAAK